MAPSPPMPARDSGKLRFLSLSGCNEIHNTLSDVVSKSQVGNCNFYPCQSVISLSLQCQQRPCGDPRPPFPLRILRYLSPSSLEDSQRVRTFTTAQLSPHGDSMARQEAVMWHFYSYQARRYQWRPSWKPECSSSSNYNKDPPTLYVNRGSM